MKTTDVILINADFPGLKTFEAKGVPRHFVAQEKTFIFVFREVPRKRLSGEMREALDKNSNLIAGEGLFVRFFKEIRDSVNYVPKATDEERAVGRKITAHELAYQLGWRGVPSAICGDIAENILWRAGC